MPNTWITDLEHLPPPDVEVPKASRVIADYFFRIADEAIRLRVGIEEITTDIHCRRRPGRRPCKGLICMQVAEDGRLRWRCPECGDNGLMSNWNDQPCQGPYPLYLEEKQVSLLLRYLDDTEWVPILKNGQPEEGELKFELDMDELDDLWIIVGHMMDEARGAMVDKLEVIQDRIGWAMDGC